MANISAKANFKLTTPLAFFEKNFNISYVELGCVSYNPDYSELTATIKMKRSCGYGGNLCTDGSYESVRCYVDYAGGYSGVPQVIGVGEANNIVRAINVVDDECKILTATDKNWGMISLVMEHKAILDSGCIASYIYAYRQFCLKD